MVLIGAYGVFCSFHLVRKSPTALRHTNVCLVMWFVFWAVNVALQVGMTGHYAGFGSPLLWALYLTSSKRVANTYGAGAKASNAVESGFST